MRHGIICKPHSMSTLSRKYLWCFFHHSSDKLVIALFHSKFSMARIMTESYDMKRIFHRECLLTIYASLGTYLESSVRKSSRMSGEIPNLSSHNMQTLPIEFYFALMEKL
jgi:hypothetical protein